jgi:hypothetical protein
MSIAAFAVLTKFTVQGDQGQPGKSGYSSFRMSPVMAACLTEQLMQHRRRHGSHRGLLDAGPAGVLWGLLVVITLIIVVAIFFWLLHALVVSVLGRL